MAVRDRHSMKQERDHAWHDHAPDFSVRMPPFWTGRSVKSDGFVLGAGDTVEMAAIDADIEHLAIAELAAHIGDAAAVAESDNAGSDGADEGGGRHGRWSKKEVRSLAWCIRQS